MSAIGAGRAGTFTIGDTTINRLGYGAMRITSLTREEISTLDAVAEIRV